LKQEKINIMQKKVQDNKSIPEKILEDFFDSLEGKEEFDDSLISKLKVLGKGSQLSNQKAIEDLITPK